MAIPAVAVGKARASRSGTAWTALLLRADWLKSYLRLSPALLVMLLLMVVPVCALVLLSFWRQQGFTLTREFSLDNYAAIVRPSAEPRYIFGIPLPFESIYPPLILKSILMSLAATTAAVLLAYPMACFLAFRVRRHKLAWLVVVTLPFWTSYLLRLYAWKVILGSTGVINSGLLELGLIAEPLQFLLYNPLAVVIVLTHAWAACAVLPIYVSLDKIDPSLLEAATNLGDSAWHRFWRVILPLSLPGVTAASLLVFIPTVGDYFTPQVVGGTGGLMIGNVIQSLFTKTNNAPLGAALSIVTMTVVALVALAFLLVVGARARRLARAGGRA